MTWKSNMGQFKAGSIGPPCGQVNTKAKN